MGKVYECAFRVNDRRCSVLTKKSCFHCPFHMTKEELIERRKKAEARIKTLPAKKQQEIHDKYYAGGGSDEE